jgi:hypothetical protein
MGLVEETTALGGATQTCNLLLLDREVVVWTFPISNRLPKQMKIGTNRR